MTSLHCFLAFCAQDVFSLESDQAEGIGEIEVDWVGGWEGIADEIKEPKDHHGGFDIGAQEMSESEQINHHSYDQHFRHEVY